MESKDKTINEKSLGLDRLNNAIILMKNRFEEIENSEVKKIIEYKAKIHHEMSVKIENLKNTEENNTHLRKKSEKQQLLDLASKTKEITNLKQQIINLEKLLKKLKPLI